MRKIREFYLSFIRSLIQLKFFYILITAIIFVVGIVFIFYTWQTSLKDTREQVLKLAMAAEKGFSKLELTKLEAKAEDIEKPEYKQIKDSLIKIVELDENIQFSYIYTKKEDNLVFMVDSEPLDSEKYLPPGEAYIETNDMMFRPFIEAKPMIIGPKIDNRGTWISALVPMIDYGSGKVIAVFAIDYPANTWNECAIIRTVQAAIIVLCMWFILISLSILVKKNIELRAEKNKLSYISSRLAESERSKSVLLDNLPGMAYRCKYDKDWTMLFVSKGCFELTGYKVESLLYNKDLSYSQLIFSKYQDYILDKWDEAVKNKGKFKEEYEIITASGEIKWVFEQGQGIYDEEGEVIALEGLIIDITARKRREEEIKYLAEHDYLTGLYNRIYFEQEKERLNKEEVFPLSVIIGDINGVKFINDVFGHGEGDKLIVQTAKVLKSCCGDTDILARTGGDEFRILMPNADRKAAYEMIEKIRDACKEFNSRITSESSLISMSLGCDTKASADENLDDIIKKAEDNMYKRKLLEQKSSHSTILSSMRATLYARSQETEEHAERLADLSKQVGVKLNLSPTQIHELELLAMLHDIGKVGIDDRILNKCEKLTKEEWKEMKKHPEIGYRIAMSSPEFRTVAKYILHHHENWDGTGYPKGLKGEDIPLLSRIISVVDAYDAMTQDRIYRKGMSKEEAIKEIRKNAGTQFDPKIVSIFINEVLS